MNRFASFGMLGSGSAGSGGRGLGRGSAAAVMRCGGSGGGSGRRGGGFPVILIIFASVIGALHKGQLLLNWLTQPVMQVLQKTCWQSNLPLLFDFIKSKQIAHSRWVSPISWISRCLKHLLNPRLQRALHGSPVLHGAPHLVDMVENKSFGKTCIVLPSMSGRWGQLLSII